MDSIETLGPMGMLIAAVGYLWREQQATRKLNADRMEAMAAQQEAARLANVERLRQCEDEHRQTSANFVKLSAELGEVKGHQAGVTQMAQQVLDVITERLPDE